VVASFGQINFSGLQVRWFVMSSKVIVFGGNGFIGSNLVEELVKQGKSVVVYDRAEVNSARRLPGVEYIVGEFGNIEMISDILSKDSVVYHLVSTSLPSTSNKDPGYDITSNVVTTISMLKECVQAEVARVVFISSGGAIYGIPKSLPVDETQSTNPLCSYGISKLTIEKYLALFNHLYGLNYVVLRPSNPYGIYKNPIAIQGVISVFCNKMINNEAINLWGDGSVIRDYIYINDLVDALILAGESESALCEIFNIASGVGLSINKLIGKIEKVIGKKAKIVRSSPRSLDVPEIVLDVAKAKRILNWEAKTDINSGLKKTYNWLLQNNK
jgi:UDP-glucose 4-epimerase